MPFSSRAPSAATACLVALLLAVAALVAAPGAAGQTPSPSPSGSPSGSPGPGGDVDVTFLNPSPGYDSEPGVSDRFDGVDTRYTIVARTTGASESTIVEAAIAPPTSSGFGNDITIGQMERIAAGSDIWELDWDIPAGIAEGTARMTVRAYVDTPTGFVEADSHEVEVSLFYSDHSSPQPLGSWETVDILWPLQGGALGFYKPRVGAWRAVIDGRTSPGATHVQIMISTTPPGEPPVFTGCVNPAVEIVPTGEYSTFSGRCTLDAVTLPSQVRLVAAVAEWRDPAGNRTFQAADVRAVASYDVSPEDMQVKITPVARRVAAPATACQSFDVDVTDEFDRPILGANVDVHATGPADELILAGTTMFVPDPHTTEQTNPCPSSLPVPTTPRAQGDHNVPGGIDTKHMENRQGTGLDSQAQPSGRAAFQVASMRAGFTDLVAWVDEEQISVETEQRALDNDHLDGDEPVGRARIQWLGATPTLTLDPLGGTAPSGSCFPYVVKARAGTAPMPDLNVDVHATGPDGELDFCDPPGGSEHRAPEGGSGANAHEAEGTAEAHHTGTSAPPAQHTEGETDATGNFVVGLTSPVSGDSTVVAWVDGEPGADDDVQQGAETSTSATISWVSSTAEADLSFVNPSPYGGTTTGDGRGTQVPDRGGTTDVLVRVDIAGSVPGVEILWTTATGTTFSTLGEAERVGSSDLYTLEWPIQFNDGSYKLRARITGTQVVEDQIVTVGAGDLLPMVPNPSFESLEITRPQRAAAAAFTRRSTTVAGRASAGAEGVDVYYTKVPAKDTPREGDWILCGYADLDGTGTTPQSFTTSCTLTGADQPGQVTGISAITYDCQVDGCDANPTPPPPTEGAPPPPREPGRKDTGDAARVFGYETNPLLALEPAEAEALTGGCRAFQAILRDQTGQPIGDENVDLHLTGPDPSTHFCRPSDNAGGFRAPDAGGHTATGADSAVQLEAAHTGDAGTPLHTEGETLPNGKLTIGVTSEAAGDTQILLWLDRDDDDVQGPDEESDTAVLHWVASTGCSILGSEGPDRLRGTPGADVFCGLEGNDVIRGRGGADTVFGGSGADRIYGGNGRDSLRGGRGRDVINGGRGHDTCRGGPGRDRIRRCEPRPKSSPARRSGV